jgi:hypothetical protein
LGNSRQHIVEGIIQNGKLSGGLHTQKALDKFTQANGYTYTVLQTDPKTGVSKVKLPQSAMQPYPNGSIPAVEKTLFPPDWDDDYIMSVIEHIAETGTLQTFGSRQFIQEIVDNVEIRVAIRNGEIVTAFPII